MKKELMCFDIESGGFSPKTDALCSITLKVVGKDIVKTIFIKPNKKLKYNPGAMKVNGLTIDKLEEIGIDECDAVSETIAFMMKNFKTKPTILAHNASFDIGFMNACFERNNVTPFISMFIDIPFDTLAEMRNLKNNSVIDIQNCKLNTCYNYFFGEDIINAHTSEADVIATEKIYFKILDMKKQQAK